MVSAGAIAPNEHDLSFDAANFTGSGIYGACTGACFDPCVACCGGRPHVVWVASMDETRIHRAFRTRGDAEAMLARVRSAYAAWLAAGAGAPPVVVASVVRGGAEDAKLAAEDAPPASKRAGPSWADKSRRGRVAAEDALFVVPPMMVVVPQPPLPPGHAAPVVSVQYPADSQWMYERLGYSDAQTRADLVRQNDATAKRVCGDLARLSLAPSGSNPNSLMFHSKLANAEWLELGVRLERVRGHEFEEALFAGQRRCLAAERADARREPDARDRDGAAALAGLRLQMHEQPRKFPDRESVEAIVLSTATGDGVSFDFACMRAELRSGEPLVPGYNPKTHEYTRPWDFEWPHKWVAAWRAARGHPPTGPVTAVHDAATRAAANSAPYVPEVFERLPTGAGALADWARRDEVIVAAARRREKRAERAAGAKRIHFNPPLDSLVVDARGEVHQMPAGVDPAALAARATATTEPWTIAECPLYCGTPRGVVADREPATEAGRAAKAKAVEEWTATVAADKELAARSRSFASVWRAAEAPTYCGTPAGDEGGKL